jgi:peptidyl-prolyl cis-trans isomerase SurA
MEENKTINDDTQPVASDSKTTKAHSLFSGKFIVIFLAIALALLAGLYYMLTQTAQNDGGNIIAPANSYPEVVATVNGENVSGEELSESVTRSEQSASQQGFDTTSPEIREQINAEALNVLINTKLLLQTAVASGMSATEEQVAEQITLLEQQFGGAEGLKTQMDTLGVTDESLRADLRDQLTIETYIKASDEYGTISVTDEEIATAYANFLTQNPELPALEEIREPIREQLIAQKQQEVIATIIQRIKETADIQILI